MKKLNIAKVLIITTMIFVKETLTAQWSGTNPEISGSNVGIGWVLSPAPLTTNLISNPLGQLHISQVRPFSFTPLTLTPIPQLFLSSYCESPFAFSGITNTSYAIESDCYDGNLKINFINSTGSASNLISLNPNSFSTLTDNFYIKNYFTIANTTLGGLTTKTINLTLPLISNSPISGSSIVSNGNAFMQGDLSVNNNTYLWGKVRIGSKTATFHPDAKLSVEGKVAAQHFVITKPSNWSDRVFQKGYKMLSLYEVEHFINNNKHLPEVPSEADVMEKGYDANEMDAILLQKIEELTLHMIELKKENETLKKSIANLKKN
jgi:hypothetical protein